MGKKKRKKKLEKKGRHASDASTQTTLSSSSSATLFPLFEAAFYSSSLHPQPFVFLHHSRPLKVRFSSTDVFRSQSGIMIFALFPNQVGNVTNAVYLFTYFVLIKNGFAWVTSLMYLNGCAFCERLCCCGFGRVFGDLLQFLNLGFVVGVYV